MLLLHANTFKRKEEQVCKFVEGIAEERKKTLLTSHKMEMKLISAAFLIIRKLK